MFKLRNTLLAATTISMSISVGFSAEANVNVYSATITTGSSSKTFLGNVVFQFTGATLSSASFAVRPRTGSLTRSLSAAYSSVYLQSIGNLTALSNGGSQLNLPVFGLYSSYNNIVDITLKFTDGETTTYSPTLITNSYQDGCPSINSFSIVNNRKATSDLQFDFFLLKDYCAATSPVIFDADGFLRWIGTGSNNSNSSGLYKNVVYYSNGAGINTINLATGANSTLTSNYYSHPDYYITSTSPHNIDPGQSGPIVDINTSVDLEGAAMEINPVDGSIINEWDMARIISSAMTAGGDNPSGFVYTDGSTDWFHMNATTFNPIDNTLIVSSRENFVIAVDYNPPADGSARKIHWILGDTTKKWAQYASLRKFALTLPAGAPAPIGQHGISIDSSNNLLVFNDGLGSQTQSPAGTTRTYSMVNSYKINTSAMTATPVYNYTPSPSIYSPICGSAYEVAGTHLVDFATSNGEKTAEIQGLSTSNAVIFDMKLTQADTCGAGWNAFPISNQFQF